MGKIGVNVPEESHVLKKLAHVKINTYLNLAFGLAFIAAAMPVVFLVNSVMRQQALAEAESKVCVLLDLNLPRMDGREALNEIKQDADLRRIPVVILTTSQAKQDILESYELHANCYVTKPVDLAQFMRVIQSIEDFWLTVVKLPPNEEMC